jgi:hypothetical protein
MAISGKETIQIGLQNESIGSDSLYTAFNKTANNFTTLFACASPYTTFTGNGVSINANSTLGTLSITNTGVTSIVAGTNISISASNGAVQISAVGGNGNGGGTVTSVGVDSSTLSVGTTSSGNIVASGNIIVNLLGTSVVPGTYTYPTLTVDQYGRLTTVSSGASVGTVTSLGITAGDGIQVQGGPITTSGNITVVNTGVTRINSGSGITVTGSNGNVTISTTSSGGTVQSVAVSSNALVVTGSPITQNGIITVDLPSNLSITGNITSGGGIKSSNATIGIGYATGAGSTVTQGTSRTTAVVIAALSGAITLFSAAGTSAYTSFTVTNSTVAATDVIIVNQKSGTDKYEVFVTAVGTGSFQITFSDVSGTTTEQPVFNFAVIKGVTA